MVGFQEASHRISVHLRTPTAETGRTAQFPYTCEIPQADLF